MAPPYSFPPTSLVQNSRMLYRAASVGDTITVWDILNEGADANFKTRYGHMAPLHAAACHGHIQVLNLLLEAGADLNIKNVIGYTPMHFAAAWGEAKFLQKLIQAGACVNIGDLHGNTPLHLAAKYGSEACVIALIIGGAEPSAQNHANKLPKDLSHTTRISNILRHL